MISSFNGMQAHTTTKNSVFNSLNISTTKTPHRSPYTCPTRMGQGYVGEAEKYIWYTPRGIHAIIFIKFFHGDTAGTFYNFKKLFRGY